MKKVMNREDNYHPEDRYQEYLPAKDGFARFRDPDNGQWYFAFYHKDQLWLRSEGYSSESLRDAGIKAVRKYMKDDKNFRVRMLPDGKWVLDLMAPNNKEIARSVRFASDHEARAMLPTAVADRDRDKARRMEMKPRQKDDYLNCMDYRGRHSLEFPDFITFEKNKEFYFALVDAKNTVLLRSEGYRNERSRDRGMQLVMKYRKDRDRYKVEEHFGGYFVILRAGNNREIARSCAVNGDEALDLLDVLTTRIGSFADFELV